MSSRSVFLALSPVFSLLFLSSCTKETACGLKVRVEQTEFSQTGQADVLAPVANAEVRIYQDAKLGTEWLEQVKQTGPNGEAEFELAQPAILKVDVTYGSKSVSDNVILQPGETVVLPINLDE